VLLVLLVGYSGISGMHLAAEEGAPGGALTNKVIVQFTNIKTGVFAAIAVGLLFCAEHLRDTLLIRPHPAIWRAVTGMGLLYFMFIAFILFQDMDTIQAILKSLDPKLTGEALPHRSYAEDCSNTFSAVWKASDRFLVAHFVGWFVKTLMIRDPLMCHVLSFLFEILEYLFTHVQPNFAECWWDHWLLDFLICNGGGIVLGTWTLKKLEAAQYNWRGMSEYNSLSGKIRRGVAQFTPYNWTVYNWSMFTSFKRFLYVIALVVVILIVELNAFFLKDVLLVPPESSLNIYRLLVWGLVGVVAIRDYYHFTENPDVKRFGAAAWVGVGASTLELLVILKFAVEKYKTQPMPEWVLASWIAIGITFTSGTAWWFLVGKDKYLPKDTKAE